MRTMDYVIIMLARESHHTTVVSPQVERSGSLMARQDFS